MKPDTRRSVPALSKLAIATAILCVCAVLAPPSQAEDGANDALRGVPYLTNRNRTGSTDPEDFFGDERSHPKAGFCEIGERPLRFLSSVAEASPFHIPEELLSLDGIHETDADTLLERLAASSGDNAPVLFTHGFYIDFEKGCRRATAFQENVGLKERFLWFSWPSDGDVLNYAHDEADLYWSAPDLANTISTMVSRFGPSQVNVAGHSLGARGVVLALYELASRGNSEQLGEVVLLAPDMDFGIFQRMLPRIRPLVKSLTVYVTDRDWPLALSEQLHGYPRLGETGNPVETLDGVEVIDLSELPVRSASGHLYHIYNTEVADDLAQLLKEGKPASARQNLTQKGPNLWLLQPGR